MKNEAVATNKKIVKRKKGTIKAKSDFFRTARYGLTLQEHRIIYYAILEGQQNSKPFSPVTMTIKEFKELFEVSGGNYYKVLRKLSETLVGRSVEFAHKDKDGLHLTQAAWLLSIVYHFKEGTVTITPNPALKPFFEGKPFTTTEYYFLIRFTSQYAERLYEILKSLDHKKIIDFDPADLATRLGVPPSYRKDFQNFRRRVLEPAIKDINEFTDIDIDVREERGLKNKVEKIYFSLHKKKVPKLADRVEHGDFTPPLSDEEQEAFARELLGENEIEGQMSLLNEAVFRNENN